MHDPRQELFDRLAAENNTRTLIDFEGYSPDEMHGIFYNLFEAESPVQLQALAAEDYQSIPMLSQLKYLAEAIEKEGELKLTSKGFLPTKLVADIYAQGFLKDWAIEEGISKLYKETDAETIHLTRLLLELSGIAKKRSGKLSLTKKGEKIISDKNQFLDLILRTFIEKFNWAYFDGYGDNGIGQLGAGFSFILLKKYGLEQRPASFYGEKYFQAFPHLLAGVEDTEKGLGCYALRTFDRFLAYFGLVDLEGNSWQSDKKIKATPLLDKLIQVQPPRSA